MPHHAEKVAALCRAAIERFDLPVEFRADALQFIDGHAIPYAAAINAIRLLARKTKDR